MKHCGFRLLLTLLVTLLFLSGCTTLPESQTNVEYDLHQSRLETIKKYQSFGKIGYISPEQRESLNFQWKHSDTFSQLRLTTLLGQTALLLEITPEGASIETYDGQQLSDSDAQSLVHQLTGLMLPIEPLSDWLLGKPIRAGNYALNERNTLQHLEQNIHGQAWKLDYLAYRDQTYRGLPLPLPSRLKLTHGKTTINIMITKWQFSQ